MILLDTHSWLWLAIKPKLLSKAASQSIRRASKSGGIAVASITLLEAAWLFANGRFRSSGTVTQAIARLVDATAAHVLEVTPEIAATAVQLPGSLPRDPADRLIVATALVRAIPLITRDAQIQDSQTCRVIW